MNKYIIAKYIYSNAVKAMRGFEARFKRRYVEYMKYDVAGVLCGELWLYADQTCRFVPAGAVPSGPGGRQEAWMKGNDAIKVFDHWFTTNDQGCSWFSPMIKLTRMDDRWGAGFMNSDPIAWVMAKQAYEAERLDSRESGLLKLMPENAVVAELGVESGIYAERIRQITKPRELHLIDVWECCPLPWPSADVQRNNYLKIMNDYKEEIVQGSIKVHKGDDLEYLSKFPDGYFDWVYIDTTHQYEQTLKELKLSSLKVKAGGYICGHDFTDDSYSRRHGFGVIRAVNEFVLSGDWRISHLTLDAPNSYVLQKASGQK